MIDLNVIIKEMGEIISAAPRVGRMCHDEVLNFLESVVKFKMPYDSSLIADAFEAEHAGDEKLTSIETFVHLLQCPLRALAGKMAGSRTGMYHSRNEQLIMQGISLRSLQLSTR